MKVKNRHGLHGKFLKIVGLSQKLENLSRSFGIDQKLTRTEVHLIELIGENPGISVTDLAKIQGVTKGAVSQNLKRLEGKKLTAKSSDPSNLSRSIVSLTSNGEIVYKEHKKWHEEMDGGFKIYFDSIDQEKIEFLFDFLDRVEGFLNKQISTSK